MNATASRFTHVLRSQTTYGHVIRLLQDRRGEQVDVVYMENERVMLKYKLPWQEVRSSSRDEFACFQSWVCASLARQNVVQIVTDFYDKLKSITSGRASVFFCFHSLCDRPCPCRICFV
jgi:translation elongation factor EF-4